MLCLRAYPGLRAKNAPNPIYLPSKNNSSGVPHRTQDL